MKVALLANLIQNAPAQASPLPDQWNHLDSWETIQAIIIALEKAGHQVTFLEGDETLYNNLYAIKPDICFNICQGHFGQAQTAQIPAILEMLRLPYTGSSVLALAIAFDKKISKQLLAYHGLPTPPLQMFTRVDTPIQPHLQFPLLVYADPPTPGNGPYGQLIVSDEFQLREQLQNIFQAQTGPVPVEQLINGPRISIAIIGNLPLPVIKPGANHAVQPAPPNRLQFLPPVAIEPALYPNRETDGGQLCHSSLAQLPAELITRLNQLAQAAFLAMGFRDVALVDFRLAQNNQPYILGVNPIPGLSPQHSILPVQAAAMGWPYETLVNRILEQALQRNHLKLNLNPPYPFKSRATINQVPLAELA